MLERAFGVEFTLIDGQSGEVLRASTGEPARDWTLRAELCREVASRETPEFLDDEDPLLTLALPLSETAESTTVAVATFLTRPLDSDENISRQLELLGIAKEAGTAWATQQTPWPTDTLKRISDLVLDGVRTARRAKELQQEADSLSTNLASTYEEISLLYRLTQNLKLSKSDQELGEIALDWLAEVVPASGLLLQLLPIEHGSKSQGNGIRNRPVLLHHGECLLDNARFSELIRYLDPESHRRPIVVNRPITKHPDWPYPEIRELVATPLVEGENVFGWLAALNHAEDGEFGTVEASLLSSVAAILGIHSGNIDLYRQQSELLAGIVRALTSAIDAKDPYTCGHSDRVSRVAVRLAQELGCDEKTLNTLCLAGLLHDIGKIGVNDSVLRKPAKLSDDEYEHIKQHVTTGHRILHDLVKLENVLPAVLHHHESWDGSGYPSRLDSSQIPLSARIIAVADAFDAMTSNRPYRKGMPDEKVDQILRDGAGRQWDPQVIEAFFRVREDMRRIVTEEESPEQVD